MYHPQEFNVTFRASMIVRTPKPTPMGLCALMQGTHQTLQKILFSKRAHLINIQRQIKESTNLKTLILGR